MRKNCQVKRCDKPVEMVYLSGCAVEHIEEYFVCETHALVFWLAHQSCDYEHPIIERLVKNKDGTEPTNPKFYVGEWVAVLHGKVMFHGDNPETLIKAVRMMNLAGANVYLEKGE